MALSKNLTELRSMEHFFCVAQFLNQAALDPFSLYSAMGKVLMGIRQKHKMARQPKRTQNEEKPKTSHGFLSQNAPKKPTKRRIADIAADLAAKKAREHKHTTHKSTASSRNQSILKVLQSKPLEPKIENITLPTFALPSFERRAPRHAVASLMPGIAVVTEPLPEDANRRIKIGRPPKNSLPCGTDSNGSFSRHNDMVYYPNIQCLLCEEWVCSRNRYMHIESHLQYKPYRCSVCGYDNRKEIFITLHIRRVHGNRGEVLYHPDPELEKKAWTIAEECLQHTRQLLISQNSQGNSTAVQNSPNPKSPNEKLAEYTEVYRAKISNAQRAEKTQLIEESRQLGILPEFRSGIEREIQCILCNAFVIRSPTVTEEHVRSHLTIASYLCIVPGCETAHSSRLFMLRHMKEVHKLRKSPDDLIMSNRELLAQFLTSCQRCFPTFYTGEALERIEMKYSAEMSLENALSMASSHQAGSPNGFRFPVAVASHGASPNLVLPNRVPNKFNKNCIGCQLGLTPSLTPGSPCINCTTQKTGPPIPMRCLQCAMEMQDDVPTLLRHSICHLRPLPFSCSHCSYSHWSCAEVERHNALSHTTFQSRVNLNYSRDDLISKWMDMATACFGLDFVSQFVRVSL